MAGITQPDSGRAGATAQDFDLPKPVLHPAPVACLVPNSAPPVRPDSPFYREGFPSFTLEKLSLYLLHLTNFNCDARIQPFLLMGSFEPVSLLTFISKHTRAEQHFVSFVFQLSGFQKFHLYWHSRFGVRRQGNCPKRTCVPTGTYPGCLSQADTWRWTSLPSQGEHATCSDPCELTCYYWDLIGHPWKG